MGEKVEGTRSIIGRYKIDGARGGGAVKNSIGNGEAKELICITHGHELSKGWGKCWREWGYWEEGDTAEKKNGTIIA